MNFPMTSSKIAGHHGHFKEHISCKMFCRTHICKQLKKI